MIRDRLTDAEKKAQITGCSVEHGHVGYLREAYHGEPYATKVLVPEAFEELRVQIHAATLQSRLPAVLVVAEARERQVTAMFLCAVTSMRWWSHAARSRHRGKCVTEVGSQLSGLINDDERRPY
jgi:hypothetical protein